VGVNVILLAAGAVLSLLVWTGMTPGTFSHEWWALTGIVLICFGLVLTEMKAGRA
jgi:hypothetical protein